MYEKSSLKALKTAVYVSRMLEWLSAISTAVTAVTAVLAIYTGAKRLSGR